MVQGLPGPGSPGESGTDSFNPQGRRASPDQLALLLCPRKLNYMEMPTCFLGLANGKH